MVDECSFIELIIHGNGNWLYAYHALLKGPLDLEALRLSLHSLLLNPTLSVHNLRVTTQKLIWQCSVFRTALLFVMKQKKTRSWFTKSENFVCIKHSRPLFRQFRRQKQWNFALLFIWMTNAMSRARVIQQVIAYWLSTTAHSNSTASW